MNRVCDACRRRGCGRRGDPRRRRACRRAAGILEPERLSRANGIPSGRLPAVIEGTTMAALLDFARIVGERNTITKPSELRTYECDGLAGFRVRPAVVVLPETTAQVAEAVKLARALDLPIVPRGAGTGLSGGALPCEGCVVIGLARMTKILGVDLANRRMRVQPGVINLDLSQAARAAWILLRARSFVAERVHDRRQRGGELRRRALSQIWLHRQSRGGGNHRHLGRRHRRRSARAPASPMRWATISWGCSSAAKVCWASSPRSS